jgi:hypothetical protein
MPGDVMLDALQLQLFLPASASEAVGDAARAALAEPDLPERVRGAVERIFAAVPALAVLTVRVSW